MNSIYVTGYIISAKIVSLYDKLLEYSYPDTEKCEEYYECLEKIRKLIKIEDEEYEKLDLDFVNRFIDEIGEKTSTNSTERRYLTKLFERKNDLLDLLKSDINASLTVINSKILIDVLKCVDEILNNDFADKFDDECFWLELLSYHNDSKYELFTSNNFLEKLALAYNFEIEKIPSISFSDIEQEYGTDVIQKSQGVFFDTILDKIKKLLEIDDYEDNYVDKVYYMIYNFCSIDVLLGYLSKDRLIEVINYYNQIVTNSKSTISKGYIKKLIDKRKEGFTSL